MTCTFSEFDLIERIEGFATGVLTSLKENEHMQVSQQWPRFKG